MGKRGNIGIVQNDFSMIYFYTRWDGQYLDDILSDALKIAGERRRNASHMNLAVFAAMSRRCSAGEGRRSLYEKAIDNFGISTRIGIDNEHLIRICHPIKGVISHKDDAGRLYAYENYDDLIRRVKRGVSIEDTPEFEKWRAKKMSVNDRRIGSHLDEK